MVWHAPGIDSKSQCALESFPYVSRFAQRAAGPAAVPIAFPRSPTSVGLMARYWLFPLRTTSTAWFAATRVRPMPTSGLYIMISRPPLSRHPSLISHQTASISGISRSSLSKLIKIHPSPRVLSESGVSLSFPPPPQHAFLKQKIFGQKWQECLQAEDDGHLLGLRTSIHGPGEILLC